MNNTYYVDLVSQITTQGDIVKIQMVNVNVSGQKVNIENKFSIAMKLSSFVKMRDTVNELFEKITKVEEKPVKNKKVKK